jgi:tetratricopeptide (TPR) repeat protein
MSRVKAGLLVILTLLAPCLRGQLRESSVWQIDDQTAAGTSVAGDIQGFAGSVSEFSVLLGQLDGRAMTEGDLQGDGTFLFANVPSGPHLLRLVRGGNETLLEGPVQIQPGCYISLQFPKKAEQSAGGSISVDRLRHPLSGKAAKLIRKALDLARSGDHLRAIGQLNEALREPTAAPYAHSILGMEYLKTRQVGAAKEELEQAVQLLPHDSVDHSNLGYALLLSGDRDRAEREVRLALELDHGNPATQHLLNYILEARQK